MNVRTVIGALRVGIGLFAWFNPSQTEELFGLAKDPTPATSERIVMSRLLGIRELVLGGALLVARHPEAKRLVLQMGIVSDSADAIAAAIGYKNGISTTGLIRTGGAACFGVLLGAYGLSTVNN